MAMVLVGIGAIMAIAGFVWFLVLAFQEGALWGIGCFFCWIVQVVFLIQNFDKSWKPFALQIVGGFIAGVGSAMIDPGQFPQ